MATDFIKVDFEKVFKQAEELEKIAGILEKIGKSDLTDSMTEISDNWSGENAKSYTKKGAIVCDHIKQSAMNLNKTAKVIREMAQKYKKAEEEVENLANMRTYRK